MPERDAQGRFVSGGGTNVGHASVSIFPDMSKFGTKLSRGLKTAAIGGGIAAAFGVGKFVKDSVQLEATFSRTMAEIKVATQSSGAEMKRLDDLALKLGKSTVFSAGEAASAMLELSKNGIKPATIQAGALKSALVLAAAGGTDLTFAAKTMGNAINAFGLKGEDAASVAAALAGAANASSASVESLAQGLQQSATGANAAGLSVQETTGILAAFANAGIDGSDAGTSLKTMLTRLIPATDKVSKAMKKYGLVFTTSNGEFKSAAGIAQELKGDLGDLSDVEKAGVLNTVFGSDARRAATILTNEGAEGIRKYIKATSDQGAAEELAQAKMKGTAGDMERLSGAWETARLEFGQAIAPTVREFLKFLTSKLEDLSPKLTEFGDWFNDKGAPALKGFADQLKPLANDLLPAAGSALGTMRDFGKKALPFIEGIVEAFNDMPGWAKKALVGGVVGGTLFVKFGGASLLKGLTGGLFSKGATPVNPLYVLDVAKGVGKGGLGTGSKVLGALGKGGLLAAFGVEAVIGTKMTKDAVTEGVKAAITQGSFQGGRPGGSGGQDTPSRIGGVPFVGIGASQDAIDDFNRSLDKTRIKIYASKQGIEEFGQSVRTRIPRVIETKFTLLGIDVANGQINGMFDTFMARNNRLQAAFDTPTPGQPPDRTPTDGVYVHVEKVVSDSPDRMLSEIQRRKRRASSDGVGR